MAQQQGKFAIEVDPVEFKSLITVLRQLDKEQSAKVRDGAFPLSQRLAGQLHQFAMVSPTPQTKLVAQTITPKRDRLVRVGSGSSTVPCGARVPARGVVRYPAWHRSKSRSRRAGQS